MVPKDVKGYFAHSVEGADTSCWQTLPQHLADVADLAANLGAPLGMAKATALAGLLHDLGKYDPAFQARLHGSKTPLDHSTAGAFVVRQLPGIDRGMAELIAYSIAGHHAGLPDGIAEQGGLRDRLKSFALERLDSLWQAELSPDATDLLPERIAKLGGDDFRIGFMGRMIFSCLVDADFRDTEAFYARTEGRDVDRAWPLLPETVEALGARFDLAMAKKGKADSGVNRLRSEILAHVRAQAVSEPGFFTLTVPTGGGKTLASLGFALDHAARHGHRRIICAIPYTSIIDQTAAIFRDVLGEDVVLEHHSAIDEENPRGERRARDKIKLAMENWEAPVVVTTNVQFFESLFAARGSRCRKLHNIAGSVIVLDEAQTIPRPFLIPAVRALRELVEVYGCSIVLCTATQPALDARNFTPVKQDGKLRPHHLALALEGRELAPDPVNLAQRLKRVTLAHAGALDDASLVSALGEIEQGLVIVNSRQHARRLFEAAKGAGFAGVLHLTTRQYAAHRRRILEDVRQCLNTGAPCRLIATSLIEAGVDVDFPRVWRAESGLDQIMQAAGRCNREGLRPVEASIVTIFTAPDDPPPAEIAQLAKDMNRVRGRFADLTSLEAMTEYFGEVYWRYGEDRLDREKILEDFILASDGMNLKYRTVAGKFRLIDEGLVPVIVAVENPAKELVNKLSFAEIPSGQLARGLQSYVVQVPPTVRNALIDNGHVVFEAPEQRGDQFAVLKTGDFYRNEVGLVWEEADRLGDYMF